MLPSKNSIGLAGEDCPDHRELERRRWQNWLAIVATLIAIVFGLSTTILTLLDTRPPSWPWSGSEGVLLGGLVAILLLFGVYLTRQERRFVTMSRQLVQSQEKAIADSDERFEQMASCIQEAFWTTANVDSKEYVSPAYEKILGETPRGRGRERIEWLHSVHPEDQERVKQAFLKKAVHGDFLEEYRIVRPDQSVRWIRDRAFPIHDRHGHVFKIAGIAEDITEQKELEGQLFRSQRIEAVGQLAGGVAHDFNNLLTVIIGRSQLLQHHLDRQKLNREAKLIHETAERAAALARQLLVFSRGQAAEQKSIDLHQVVVNMKDMLRRLIGEQVELSTAFSPDPGTVVADPGQIEQVIMNLAINARDAMPTGGKLVIETENVELDEEYARQHVAVRPGPYVKLSVSDTGTGMSREIQDHIFDPFFTTKDASKGSGLGLSVAYGIVKSCHGNIWVYSEAGHGTVFKVYLPRVRAQALVEDVEASEESPQGTETILLVEDQDAVRELAREILESCGYKVLEAPHGPQALLVAEEHQAPIHLLVTDTVMPEMDGVELARRLEAVRPEMKVLYMSGYTENAVQHQAAKAEDWHFLQKPFTLQALARKARRVLDSAA